MNHTGPTVGAAPLLEVDGVTLQYKTKQHLVTATYRVGFNVHRGDRFIVLGPSGCGKSTLLKGVAGFLKPVEGTIRLNGKRDPEARPRPHDGVPGVRPAAAVEDRQAERHVPDGDDRPLRRARGRAAGAARRSTRSGSPNSPTSIPHMLSGGMKQRVAIARAMAMEPDILLMDEPFAALDALTRRKMQEELLQLWDDIRFTVLFVTHSIEEAIIVGNRILVLSPHPGQVKAELNSGGHGARSAASVSSRCRTASTTCCSPSAIEQETEAAL